MTEEKRDNALSYVLIAAFIVSGLFGGGYFLFVSAVLSVFLGAVFLWQLFCSGRLAAVWDINLAAVLILPLGYFAAALWAVDSGMALTGGVKFLPVLLFFLLLCRIPERREGMIALLPAMGCLMTVFSFVMKQFPVFEDYVSVAGRLAGFFQYPNTYALFMLICLIISFYAAGCGKTGWFFAGEGVIALAGIYLSGSRTVFALTLMVFLCLLVSRRGLRRYVLLCGGVLLLVLALGVALGGELAERFLSFPDNLSTFWGRLLYARDAAGIIAAHPLGLGYYGYYFIQQEVQTGVYSVVNVHNELLQLMLDIGIVPALVVYGAIARSLLSKRLAARDRLVLLVILLHSLFDYDFQFLVMWFVLLLFLELRNVKKLRVSVFTKAAAAVSFAAAGLAAFCTGVSDYYYLVQRPEESVRFYEGNTMAWISLLEQAETTEEMEQAAEEILRSNEQVSFAYSAKARAALAAGDVEAFIYNKLLAIEKAPYQYEEYIDYLDSLAACADLYLEEGDRASAERCVECAEEIPDMLEEVKERTSGPGWRIRDLPEVRLSDEKLELIEEMRRDADEYGGPAD